MTVRVLVVEDTDHVREMLGRLLELQGFEVAGLAATATEGLRLAEETAPDVVVMDYKMPDMNGLEATKRLREVRPDQSVILYSAYAQEAIGERAREAGVVAVVSKSQGVEALAREIAAVALSMGRDPDDRD